MTAKIHIQVKWIFLLLALYSCQTAPVPPPTLSPEHRKESSLVVRLDAPTFISRDGWNDYQPIGFGTIVYPSDLLRTDGNILLLCPDMQTVKIFTNEGRNPCPLATAGNWLSYEGMLLESSTRGAPPNSVPYILYPRATAILESRPLLHWNNTGASSYTVEIWQEGDILWKETNVTTDSLVYPDDAPALQPSEEYLLVVTDNDTDKSSNSDPNKGLGFQLVSAEQRAEIENQRRAISNLAELDSTAQKVALALYLNQIDIDGRGLWADATALFEEVLNVRPDAPAVYLHAGASLARMRLWAKAQSAYESALMHAETLNDLESQADALAALWRITGDESQYEQARQLYERLGAQDKADAIKKEHSP